MVSLAAKESGLDKDFISKLNQSDDALRTLYLTTAPVKYAIEAQEAIIKKIAENGSCLIVGIAADYVLRDREELVSIFIHAPKDYRVKNVMQMYNDTENNAVKYIEKSDKNRSTYYKAISSKNWNNLNNYDLSIDSSIGVEKTADIICEYIKTSGKIM